MFLNKAWSTITGGLLKSKKRPDVGTKNKNNTYDVFEVPSKTDKVKNLTKRMNDEMNKLPKKNQGKTKIVKQKRKDF